MTILALLAVALLVVLNAFYVVAEYALVRSRRSRLEEAAEEGRRGARQALRALDEISDYISACQVGVTLASIGIGALGEPTIRHLVQPLLGPVVGEGVAVFLAFFLAYLVITSVHITFGELIPKLYAIVSPEAIIRTVSRPLYVSKVAFSPFSRILTAFSHRFLRLFGVDPATGDGEGGSPDELKRLIAESVTGGKLDEGEAGMLSGVFELHEQGAQQVMTPIPAVVTVDTSEDVETALKRCVSSGHTRLLVTEDENQDRVKGLVHSNELARLLMSEGPQASIEPAVREAPIIPETKPLDDLLADLQRQRSSLAVVVDEYGRVVGIVAVEDIIEEVVGEITDETDPAGSGIRRLANGEWYVRGFVGVNDLVHHGLELPVDNEAYNSIGGFVFASLGRLPKRGDTVSVDSMRIRVESVRENRVEAVRITTAGALATGAAATAAS